MNLTKKEIIKYIVTILLIGAASWIVEFLIANYAVCNPSGIFADSYNKVSIIINWAFLIPINILSAYYIHVSEKRGGNKTNIIWQLLGLVFGFIGFLGYAAWSIMIKNDYFIEDKV